MHINILDLNKRRRTINNLWWWQALYNQMHIVYSNSNQLFIKNSSFSSTTGWWRRILLGWKRVSEETTISWTCECVRNELVLYVYGTLYLLQPSRVRISGEYCKRVSRVFRFSEILVFTIKLRLKMHLDYSVYFNCKYVQLYSL